MQDTGSSSGTWLNGNQLIVVETNPKASRPKEMKSGDVLQIGSDFEEEEEVLRFFMLYHPEPIDLQIGPG